MSDLISRQQAIDALIKWYGCEPADIGAFENIIEKLPPVQPEIIHCRDCKWHNGEINQCYAQICASMYGEDFCSRAERRES